MSALKLLPAGAVALALAISSAAATPVAPSTGPANAVTASDGLLTKVHRRGVGAGLGIGLGLGLFTGAVIANEAYRPRRGYYYDDYGYEGPYYYPSGYDGDPRVICAENFRSFEWRTGLYTTYSGEKRLCPYLK